jgi:antitoxin component of MazEF toxin-antitoxin module
MKKNFGDNFQPLQVDSITNDYYVIIPEWIVNELSWYEDTEIKLSLDGSDLILTEKESE